MPRTVTFVATQNVVTLQNVVITTFCLATTTFWVATDLGHGILTLFCHGASVIYKHLLICYLDLVQYVYVILVPNASLYFYMFHNLTRINICHSALQ